MSIKLVQTIMGPDPDESPTVLNNGTTRALREPLVHRIILKADEIFIRSVTRLLCCKCSCPCHDHPDKSPPLPHGIDPPCYLASYPNLLKLYNSIQIFHSLIFSEILTPAKIRNSSGLLLLLLKKATKYLEGAGGLFIFDQSFSQKKCRAWP